jgi:hypothetical protein
MGDARRIVLPAAGLLPATSAGDVGAQWGGKAPFQLDGNRELRSGLRDPNCLILAHPGTASGITPALALVNEKPGFPNHFPPARNGVSVLSTPFVGDDGGPCRSAGLVTAFHSHVSVFGRAARMSLTTGKRRARRSAASRSTSGIRRER